MPTLVKKNSHGRGKKVCPKCSKVTGVRTHTCECGHDFVKKDKTVKQEQKTHTKKGRGKKTCPQCKDIVGCRTKQCNCGHKFQINNIPKVFRKKKRKSILFKDLEVGDTVRIIQGSGPVWITSSGEEIPCGHSGKFVVIAIDNKGFHGRNLTQGGHGYVFMGKDEPGVGSLIRRAHKLKLVKREAKDD